VSYFIVKDKTGSLVWAGMAQEKTDALDRAARSRRLGSYRYAVAKGALAADEWTATSKPWRLCQIFGRVNGQEVELITGPVESFSDIDRLQGEIPNSLYETVEENTMFYRYL